MNPEGANNCFVGVVLHLFWQSPAFVQWLLDLQAAQPKVISGEPPSLLNKSCYLDNTSAFVGWCRILSCCSIRCKLCCRPFGSDLEFMARKKLVLAKAANAASLSAMSLHPKSPAIECMQAEHCGFDA